MSGKFAFTTSEVAALAHQERASLYASLHHHGQWRGITPRKALNGHLIWPRDEVYQVLGLVPDDMELPPGVGAAVELVRRGGASVTPEVIRAISAIVEAPGNSDADDGIDCDCTFMFEVLHVTLSRLEAQFKVSPGYAPAAARRLAIARDTLSDAVAAYEGDKS